jgi:hypothetical protein
LERGLDFRPPRLIVGATVLLLASRHPAPRWLSLACLALLSLACPHRALAAQPAPTTPAEQYIRAQVVDKHAPADLLAPDAPADHHISARFLIDLLTGPTAAAHPVDIANAIVDEAVDLSYVEVVADTTLRACEFTANLSLANAQLKRSFAIVGTTFDGTFDVSNLHASRLVLDGDSFAASVVLYGAVVDSDLSLADTSFARDVNFTRARIGGQLMLDRAKFNDATTSVNFNTASIGTYLWARDGVEFHGPVDFSNVSVGTDVWLNNAKFLGTPNRTSFYGVKVGANVELADAVFDGPTNFTRADIKGQLTLDRAIFRSPANFNVMSIGSYLWMRDGTAFHGPADFTDVDIGIDINAAPRSGNPGVLFYGDTSFEDAIVGKNVFLNSARFWGKTATVSFYAMKVGIDVQLPDATFSSAVNFSRTNIQGELLLDRAKFSDPVQAVNFNTSTIGTYLFMRDGTEFDGPVDFSDVGIGKSAIFNGAMFLGNKTLFNAIKIGSNFEVPDSQFSGEVNFTATNVQGQLLLDRARFENPLAVNFNTSSIGTYLFLRYGTRFNGPVDLTDVSIGTNLDASSDIDNPSTRFGNGLMAEQAKIGKGLYLQRAQFVGRFSLRRTTVGGALRLAEAQFFSTPDVPEASFEAMQVGALELDRAEFNGPVTFFETQVADRFSAQGACFRSQGGKVNLGGMKVGDVGTLRLASFNGPVDFSTTSFNRVDVRGARWGAPQDTDTNVCRPSAADHVAAPSTAFPSAPSIADLLLLMPGSEAQQVQAQNRDNRQLTFTYQMLYAGDAKSPDPVKVADWEDMRKLLETFKYESTNYARAEAFYKQAGQPLAADDAFVAHEDWERDHVKAFLSSEWFGSWIRGLIVGYGRHPGNALAWGGGIVLLAWVGLLAWSEFCGGRMVPRESEESARTAGASAFRAIRPTPAAAAVPPPAGARPAAVPLPDRLKQKWNALVEFSLRRNNLADEHTKFYWFPDGLLYVLEVFAPVISLKVQDHWRPNSYRIELAEKILSIAGWVIVPLGVAGITGLVK